MEQYQASLASAAGNTNRPDCLTLLLCVHLSTYIWSEPHGYKESEADSVM